MTQESDSFDDFLDDPSTTNANDRKPGKFCPKPRAKTPNQAGESLVTESLPSAAAAAPANQRTTDIECGVDFLNGDVQNASATARAGRFQPKPKPKPKPRDKTLTTGGSNVETGVTKSVDVVSIPESSDSALYADVVQTDASLEVVPSTSIAGAATTFESIEAFVDIFAQPSATSAEQTVGKFQPKRVTRPKQRKAKSVTFDLPALETQSKVLPFTSTGVEPSIEMISGGILDETQQSSACANFQLNHGQLREEEAAEFSGLESLGDFPAESTLTPDQSVSKFQPKLVGKTKDTQSETSIPSRDYEGCSLQRDSCDMGNEALESHDVVFEGDTAMWNSDSMTTGLEQWDEDDLSEMSKVKAASSGSNEVLHSINTPLEREIPEDQTQQVIDETGTIDVQNQRASRILRKRRKKNDATISGKLDGVASEDWDVENPSISQMDEDHNDDDYRDEDMHIQNKVSRKSKRQTAENPKIVRKRKKTPEETGSGKKEPPKKRFPHGTRRRRRKVDTELLEKPGEELTIRELIIIAESKERTASKEAATLGTDQSNIGSHFYDEYGNPEMGQDLDDEALHRQMLENSTKLNYHTYMDRPKSMRWSKSETEQFYEAIRHFGTDFEMIQQLFPSRTRHQVKLKFKNEERKHPSQISDAIKNPSKDHSYFERLIRQLKAQAEKSRQEAYDYYQTTSEPAAVVNEEGRGRPEKEVQEANTFEGDVENSTKNEDWDEDDQNTSNQDWNEDAVDWEADPSSEKLSGQEANGYPATVSQDAANENKEKGDDPEKEVPEVNGFEDEDWNEDAQNAADDWL